MNATRIVAISGGVGGAKLALGLYRILPAHTLGVVVNTGDDFRHIGLYVSPDVDTVLYTLSGRSDTERGWGRAGETWRFMAALRELGGEDWFQLGDTDLAIHVLRTQALAEGRTLGDVTAAIATRLKIAAAIWPMSDDSVQTMLHTRDGTYSFQEYFVKRRCEPVVTGFDYVGAAAARCNAQAATALASPALEAIVIAPSNPYLSVDPILAVPGIRMSIERRAVPAIAVSPIVAGRALKDPAAKIMRELGVPVTPAAIAQHYGGLIDGLVVDRADTVAAEALAMPILQTDTVMESLADRERLAREVLEFARSLPRRGPSP